MEKTNPSQVPLPPPPAENPVVAIGRKVKAALSSHQQPSVRIIRDPPTSSTEQHRLHVPNVIANKFGHHTSPPRHGNASPNRPDAIDHQPPHANASPPQPDQAVPAGRLAGARNRVSGAFQSLFSHGDNHSNGKSEEREYDSDTVDLLDVVDPEVATLSTLTNVQNSLFVPSVGRIFDRRPTYRLSSRYSEAGTIDKVKASLKRITSSNDEGEQKGGGSRMAGSQETLRQKRGGTTPKVLKDAQYAILPDGETLPGWTQQEEAELDDHVRHVLHSRRAKFKRAMKGFSQYVRRPLGLFVTVYATLITLFGAAWVIFLIGWISLGSKRDYIINVVDYVLVALFAVIGDGLAPFRAVDTYHMIYIAHYHRKTSKRRVKLGLPDLVDPNDLPDQRIDDVTNHEADIESLVARKMPRSLARFVAPGIPKRFAQKLVNRSRTNDPLYEYSVLTEEEQAKLEYHERKFSKSHTFYKPHETETHFAFPFKLLIAIVVILDCHSALQITLGACTWGIPYETRPFALTTVILCFSITANILGGVLISVGDKKTRKKEVIERMMRQEITAEAIQEMENRWMKEAEERGDLDPSVRRRLVEEREEAENEEIKKAWKVVPSLPKHLLGKGEDHRQPSLPQKARTSSASIASSSSSPSNEKSKSRSSAALPPLAEHPPPLPRPRPVVTKGQEAPAEGRAQRALKMLRKADLDRS